MTARMLVDRSVGGRAVRWVAVSAFCSVVQWVDELVGGWVGWLVVSMVLRWVAGWVDEKAVDVRVGVRWA